jgi:peptidyl-prolyl cis-trans isomerase SurA
MMISRLLAVIFCIAFINVISLAQSHETSEVLFTVAKEPVYSDEFSYLFKKNHSGKQGESTEAKIEEYLQLFINFKVKVAEAKRRGYDTTQAFIREFGTYRQDLRKPYLPDAKMLDSLVKLTYNRMKEEVRASHILINVAAEALPEDTLKAYNKIMELRKRIVNGENFDTIAAEYSEDPSAKTNHGDLGYFTAMQMVFPFEQAAYSTGVGMVSKPVRTSFGYHIIKVTGRQPARGEVEVSHIMIRTGEGFDNDKAKNQIFDVYDQLQKGRSWDELCKEYSQDPSSKDTGGRLRTFGIGAMATVPEFEQIAFALKKPGDFSDPFQTRFGWHIIKLEKKVPLPSFEELAPTLKEQVSRDQRSEISRQAIQDKMKREFSFSENSSAKNLIQTLTDTTLSQGKWKPKAGSYDPSVSLFSIQGKSFSMADFVSYIKKSQRPKSIEPAKYMNEYYDAFVTENLGLQFEEKIKKKNPDYEWLLKEYYEGILLFEIMEREVWNKATEDSIGQRNYYNSHVANYQAKERIKGKIFTSQSLSNIEQLKALIEKGDSAKIQNFITTQKIRQESGAFEKTDRPVLGKTPWSPGIHLSENNGTQYLVWIKSMLPPGQKSFNEARSSVISDYQTYLENSWLDKLKKKYPVKVNKKSKQNILKRLQLV